MSDQSVIPPAQPAVENSQAPIQQEPASTAPTGEWRRTSIPGLYQRANGTFYSRYSMNGKRTWRSLNTDVFTVARLRHETGRGGVELARQSGTQISSDLRTLGALAAAFESEVALMNLHERTKKGYHDWIVRLRANWRGDFDATLARSVTRETVLHLRQYLQRNARHVNGKTEHVGYKPAVINQTLSCLRLLLELAKKHHVIAQSPFDERGLLGQSLYLPAESRRPDIPDNATMERIFAEMARVPDSEVLDETTRKYFEQCAVNASRHARFLAYSGLRLAEAQAATIDDDKGDFLVVHGTKSATSRRRIPIIPPLRTLLDQIKTERLAGPILQVAESRKQMQRACARLGLRELRHHDLRHYFCTACIESGVPIPTVAGWLGHADGGALLMKVYSHLRDTHSVEAAKLVTLRPPAQVMTA